jgi:hypothetical protein
VKEKVNLVDAIQPEQLLVEQIDIGAEPAPQLMNDPKDPHSKP